MAALIGEIFHDCIKHINMTNIIISFLSDLFGISCAFCGKEYHTYSGLSRHRKYYCNFLIKSPKIYCIYCDYTHRRPDKVKHHCRVRHGIEIDFNNFQSLQS